MYCVYIIQSQIDASFYIGNTNNLKRRLSEHNAGHVKFTSTKKPYKLVWYCAFSNREKALDFEKYLKHGSGFAFGRKRLI